jgi:hypothetical protein
MSKSEKKCINGETFLFYQQDFPIDKIKDSKDLFKKVRAFLSKSYEYKETYFSNPTWTFNSNINLKESFDGDFVIRPNSKNIRFIHFILKADAGYDFTLKSDSDISIVYKSFNGRKIVDSVKQSSKEVKFELNGDGEGITESIGYVLSDEKQNYEKSFIEGYFEFEESEIDKSADKKLEKITDDVFVKIFNGTVNKNYSIEQTKTASGEHIEIVFASEKYLNECKKWLKDSWKKESKNMTINGNIMLIHSDSKTLKLFEALIANDDDYGCPKCSIKS